MQICISKIKCEKTTSSPSSSGFGTSEWWLLNMKWLFKRLCSSVCRFIRPSVRRSVGPSVLETPIFHLCLVSVLCIQLPLPTRPQQYFISHYLSPLITQRTLSQNYRGQQRLFEGTQRGIPRQISGWRNNGGVRSRGDTIWQICQVILSIVFIVKVICILLCSLC